MNWDSFITETKDAVVDLGSVYLSRPDTPEATNVATGEQYKEGQPAGTVMGIKPMYLIGGGIALVLLVGFLALRR